MTDEQSPDSTSRRARLATRRHRMRVVGVVARGRRRRRAASAPRRRCAATTPAPPPVPGDHATGKIVDPATDAQPRSGGQARSRRARSATPTRSGCGSAATRSPARSAPRSARSRARPASSTTTIDYKVSSGLADNGIRDWYEHAQQADGERRIPTRSCSSSAPTTRRSSTRYDSNHDGVPDWEVALPREDRPDDGDVRRRRPASHRLLARPADARRPTASTRARKALGPVMREEAAEVRARRRVRRHVPAVLRQGRRLLASRCPTRTATIVQMRISDGVHFTVDGAQYLADAVWKLLNKRWHITEQADPVARRSTTRSRRAATTTCPASATTGRRCRTHSSSSTTSCTTSSATPTTVAQRDRRRRRATIEPTTPPTRPPATTPPTQPPPVTTPPPTHRRATTPPKTPTT